MLRKRGRYAVAVLESDAEGNLTVQVKAHEQSPADREHLVGSIARALDVRLGGAPELAPDDWRQWKQKVETLEMCVEMFAHNVANVLEISWCDYQQMAKEVQRPWLAGVVNSCGFSVTLAAGRQDLDLEAWTRLFSRREDVTVSLWKQLRLLQMEREGEGVDGTEDGLMRRLTETVSRAMR